MITDLWPGLELRHLAAFEAVARERSFARAAAALGYTQPAISQQLAALERIVGQRLVERSPGRAEARLTEAGARLFAHVDTLATDLGAACRDLEDFARGEAGALRVGSFQTASARLLPGILRSYRDEHPAVEVELVESTNDLLLLDEVARGGLDLAFCLLPVDDASFESVALLEDDYVFVSQEAIGLESLDDVLDQPLLLYRSCRSALGLESALRAGGREPTVVFRSDDNAALKELVRAGVGSAILSGLWIELGGNEDLELASLRGVVPPRVLGLAWRRGRALSPAQQAFVEVTTGYAATPASSGMISSP